MCQLGSEKGYRLIGTHRYGFNAFFIKTGLGEELFSELTPATCLNNPVSIQPHGDKWPHVQNLNWRRISLSIDAS